MIKQRWPILTLLLAACSSSTGQVTPVPAAEAALRSFLQAAADNNLTAMSEHWGTSRGSAAATGSPADYQKRMVIIQTYLNGSRFRVLSNEPVQNEVNQRLIQVELARSGCVNRVPFTMVRTNRDEWLVNQFNLEQVGNPSRPCGAAADSAG